MVKYSTESPDSSEQYYSDNDNLADNSMDNNGNVPPGTNGDADQLPPWLQRLLQAQHDAAQTQQQQMLQLI
jgi:hypothetical protein